MSTDVSPAPATRAFKGNDRALLGIVLGVITFWLFAGTIGTIARSVLNDINGGPIDTVSNPLVNLDQMNLVVSVTALFSGLFIVFFGGLADRLGRVRVAITGNVLSIVGGVLVVLATGSFSLPFLLTGRAIQGLSAACIMPATMALVKTYWDGEARQRAVSMWSIGSWGGSGAAALFGGFVASTFNWRVIFYVSIVISVVSILLIRGIPESKAEGTHKRFDVVGFAIFMVAVLAMMIVLIFGRQMGWGQPRTLLLAGDRGHRVGGLLLRRAVQGEPVHRLRVVQEHDLYRRGALELPAQRDHRAAHREPADAADRPSRAVRPVAGGPAHNRLCRRHHRVHPSRRENAAEVRSAEADDLGVDDRRPGKHPARADQPAGGPVHGPRRHRLHSLRYRPGLLCHPVNRRRAVEPAPAQAGAGAGIYKMASSLGGAIGVALSLTIFSSFLGEGVTIVGELLQMQGIQSNVAVREAGMVTMLFNLILALIAIISIMATVPRARSTTMTCPRPARMDRG